jgi:hypothetical protein
MNTHSLMQTLRGLWPHWGAEPAELPTPPASDDLLLRDGTQIAQLLARLSNSCRQVLLQTQNGALMATGELQTWGKQGLAVRIHADCLLSARAGSAPAGTLAASLLRQGPINISAASEAGVLLFSLKGARLMGQWLVASHLPTELIRMQSRRHFRLCGKGSQGLLQGAGIRWDGSPGLLALRDLSEEGAGLLLRARDWQGPHHIKRASLLLDDDELPIPMLQVVHKHPLSSSAAHSSVGARMVGLQAEHLRLLRRWLLASQAQMSIESAGRPG